MPKGKGRGRGRARPARQQEKLTEVGSVHRASNLPGGEQCGAKDGMAEQFESCDSESQQLAEFNSSRAKRPAADGGYIQSATNRPKYDQYYDSESHHSVGNNSHDLLPRGQEAPGVERECGESFMKGNADGYRNSDSRSLPPPDNRKDISGNRKLHDESCAAELQNEDSLHKQIKALNVDVSFRESNVEGSLCTTSSSSYQTAANMPNSDTQGKTLSVYSIWSESQRSTKPDIAKRPDFGNQGRLIQVVANYFLLEGKGGKVFHYDVEIVNNKKRESARTIKEEKESGFTQLEIQQRRSIGKQRSREIINKLIEVKSLQKLYPFYDGHRNLYTLKPISRITEKRSADITLEECGKTKTYTVTVQPVRKIGGGNAIDLESLNLVCTGGEMNIPQEAIMAFDMLLCHRDPPYNHINIGRSFFSFTEMRKDQLDGQVEIWKGYNQSVHLTQSGPAVVVNVANKAFNSAGFVIEHACDLLGFDITTRRLEYEHIKKLSENLCNVKVEVIHLKYPRKYTVKCVTKVSAKNLPVDIDGQEISVARYFSQKYKTLNFPDLPCLEMKTKGNRTYTPMELCVILPGQPKIGKLNSRQTSDMINRTAVPPKERFRQIENYAKGISETSRTYLEQCDWKMRLDPMRLTARVISAPALAYKNQTSVHPDTRGVWRIDGKNFTAVVPDQIQWCLISFTESYKVSFEMLHKLSSAIVRASGSVGLNINSPLTIKMCDGRTPTVVVLRNAKKLNVNFAFLILSRTDRFHHYDEVKFIADVEVGLVTQCMEDVVVKKACEGPGSGQILNNIFSKLNVKLGGVNHTISRQQSVSMKETVVMGADAAHSPRGSKCPSVAAVVGSVDHVPFQYAVTCKVQKNPDETKLSQEIILDMKEMTKHVLQSYRNKNNNEVPQRIIFFRDGVSDGQFEAVLKNELILIQMACEDIFSRRIPVTFIVVQKRHQTRFKPQKPEKDGKGGNIPPGTTVDTDVAHPVYFDFFICSHEGIKGTSKPARYVVLHDDNKFKADDLQKFCYELCHVYARCNRSISIPAPAMNAHLAAARAKKYIDWHIHKDTSSDGDYNSNDTYCLPQEVVDFVNNISTIKAPMFFV